MSNTPPHPWQMACQEYQLQQAHTVTGVVPVLNVADAREHKQLVTQALAEGRAVPSQVLADYPELINTHHRHPHNSGQTLCSRPINDTLTVSDDPDQVTCPSCRCYARRGYDMYGLPVADHTAANDKANKALIEDDAPITRGDQAEYHRWELHLLTGPVRGRSFKRALKEIERPGVLRLALEQIDGADPKRREKIERRLTRLAKTGEVPA